MLRWYDEIEDEIDEKELEESLSSILSDAIIHLLSPKEIALVFVLYECTDVETITERLRITESSYYRTLQRIREKLGPYLIEMGIIQE